MRTTMNVSLPKELKKWVDEQVKAGGYGTASEYLRDVLRRARERQDRRTVDAKLIEALQSPSTEMDDKDWASIRRAAKASAARSKARR